MNKKVIVISLSILFIAAVYLVIFLYGENRSFKKELEKFEAKETLAKDMENFIHAFGKEEFSNYLIGKIKKEAEKQYAQRNSEETQHQHAAVKEIEVESVNVTYTNKKKTKAKAFATYNAIYDVGTVDVPAEYKQKINIKATWIKTDDGWKCDYYETRLDEEISQ